MRLARQAFPVIVVVLTVCIAIGIVLYLVDNPLP
jgi:preprotein translocase subunit SecE